MVPTFLQMFQSGWSEFAYGLPPHKVSPNGKLHIDFARLQYYCFTFYMKITVTKDADFRSSMITQKF